MPEKRFSKKLISLAVTLALVVVGMWALANKWTIYDHWVSKKYASTKDSSEVLSDLNLTSKGDLVYRASLTEVDNKDSFKERCPVQDYEDASVLGCYSDRKIYVLKVDEPKLAGVEEVTAAHELLHAKFERMGPSEKEEVGQLVTELRKNITDSETNELVKNYESKLGAGEGLNNEMFAIYGTQLKDVGSELEEIYRDYFKDRASIVDKYFAYNAEFNRLETVIRGYDSHLDALKSQKEALEAEIDSLGSELNVEKQEIDSLKNGGSQEQYQSAAIAYNSRVEVYNRKVGQIRSIIAQYNELVEKRNAEALSAKSLADKLNANAEER